MKGFLLGSLLLLGLGQGLSATNADAPSCVADCASRLSKQSGHVDLSTMCRDLTRQRTLFHCLMTSCHKPSYGAALGFTVSKCLEFGADISPMAPVEIHQSVGTKRQIVPTELGPAVPGASPLFSTEVLGFDHKLALAIDCRSGSDGVVTLSIAGSNPAATPEPSFSNGGFRGHGVSQASVMEAPNSLPHDSSGNLGDAKQPDCNQSTTLPSAHQTWCLCDVSSSSTVPYSFPSPSFSTSLQLPVEHNTEPFPLSTTSLGSQDLMTPTNIATTDDCKETSALGNATTIAPNQPWPSVEFSSSAQAPRLGTENCSEPTTLQWQSRPSSFVGPSPTSFANITTPAVQNQPLTTEATPCLNSSLPHDSMPASTGASASSLSPAADVGTNSSSARLSPLATTSVYSSRVSDAIGEPCSNSSSVIPWPLSSSPTPASVVPTVADEPCSNSSFIHTSFFPDSRTISAPDSTLSTPCAENVANSTLADAQARQSPVSTNCTTEAKTTMPAMHIPSATRSLYPVSANTTSVQPVSSPLSTIASTLQSSSWTSLAFQTPQWPLASSPPFPSTLVNSTSMWPSFEMPTSGPPKYTAMAQPTLEAYLPPLPAYSYDSSQLPEYSPADVVSPSPNTTQATMTTSTSSFPIIISSSSSTDMSSPPPMHSAGQPDLYEGAVVGNDGDYGQEDGRNTGIGKPMALKHARGTPLDPTGRFAVLAMSQDDSQEAMATSRPDMLGKLGASEGEADGEALVLTAAGPPILKPSLLLLHGAMLLVMARVIEG
ncbi:hypothetical protein CDD82_5053 [Ophiocordyceps australis]|uniref:Extracellular membrane protein CFEM domain-containing protein n=1 Tax=Ophiocordyceps australis TaxID=1399860 RepID=A0A2C5Z480_9HYPO|nr:hypothetical protein CDD82_5053 [Ophiocordyceps australis]